MLRRILTVLLVLLLGVPLFAKDPTGIRFNQGVHFNTVGITGIKNSIDTYIGLGALTNPTIESLNVQIDVSKIIIKQKDVDYKIGLTLAAMIYTKKQNVERGKGEGGIFFELAPKMTPNIELNVKTYLYYTNGTSKYWMYPTFALTYLIQ